MMVRIMIRTLAHSMEFLVNKKIIFTSVISIHAVPLPSESQQVLKLAVSDRH